MDDNEHLSDCLQHLLIWLASFAPESDDDSVEDGSQTLWLVRRAVSQLDEGLVKTAEFWHFSTAARVLLNYLENIVGKRVKKQLRQQLFEQQQLQCLLGVLLFCCVHGPRRDSFIRAILQLPSSTQLTLRLVIEQTDSLIENIMEIKEVLSRIEQLEEENEELKKRLQEEDEDKLMLKQRLEEAVKQIRQLEKQCDGMIREKQQAMRELNILSVAEYVEMYRELQLENQDLLEKLRSYERHNAKLQDDRGSYTARILQDGQIITQLNTQLERVKGICKTLRLSSSFSMKDLDITEEVTLTSIDSRVLKENKIIPNLELSLRELTVQKSQQCLCRSRTEPIEDHPTYLLLRQQLDEVVQQCQKLDQAAQRESLQRRNLQKQCSVLKQQLSLLRHLHKQFRRSILEA